MNVTPSSRIHWGIRTRGSAYRVGSVHRKGFRGFRGIICIRSQCSVAAKRTENEEQMGNLCCSQTQAAKLNRRSWLHIITQCHSRNQMRWSNRMQAYDLSRVTRDVYCKEAAWRHVFRVPWPIFDDWTWWSWKSFMTLMIPWFLCPSSESPSPIWETSTFSFPFPSFLYPVIKSGLTGKAFSVEGCTESC